MSLALGTPDAVAARLAQRLGVDGALLPAHDAAGTVCVDVPVDRWHDVLSAARDGLGLDILDWLSAVDEPDAGPPAVDLAASPAVDLVAHLVRSTSGGVGRSPLGVERMLLRARLRGTPPTVRSVTDLWPGAAWHERETHEMFGVAFTGFDDGTGLGLRPLLLPDGFEGTPLRKSFVLTARASKPWPGAKEPGEPDPTTARSSRRSLLPPGVPDAGWGPREWQAGDATGQKRDAESTDAESTDGGAQEPGGA
ncbi:MAG: NADH-quinone oxidoreductase subunit C [Angustibacter sp.]